MHDWYERAFEIKPKPAFSFQLACSLLILNFFQVLNLAEQMSIWKRLAKS